MDRIDLHRFAGFDGSTIDMISAPAAVIGPGRRKTIRETIRDKQRA
jgi:hypothetical protein